MKVLVTGATGYIGQEVVEKLTSMGYEIIPFSRSLGGDIRRFSDVRAAVKGCDAVIHLAASKDHSGDYEKIKAINADGTLNVLRAAEDEGIERVVYASSVAVTENSKTPYSMSKIEAEKIVTEFQSIMTIPIMRIAPVYDEERLKIMKKLKVVPVVKGLMLHLVYLEKAVEAICLSMVKGKSEVYFVADKRPFLSEELACALRDTCKPLFISRKTIDYGKRVSSAVSCFFRGIGLRSPITPEMISAFSEDRNYNIKNTISDLGYKPVDTLEKFREIMLSQ